MNGCLNGRPQAERFTLAFDVGGGEQSCHTRSHCSTKFTAATQHGRACPTSTDMPSGSTTVLLVLSGSSLPSRNRFHQQKPNIVMGKSRPSSKACEVCVREWGLGIMMEDEGCH